MKKYVVLIVVVLGTLRASAQNSALLAGSGTGIFLDSLKDGKQVGPNSVSFADNKGVFKAGKITYSGRYFLQSYQVSFQYGLNRQGVPASSAVLDLKAGEKDFIDVKQAVHKADSIGSALKQVLSASTDAKMAVVIDGPQKYLGLEHFNIRTEEGGWSFIKPGISGRLHSFEINSLFYPLKQHLPADSVKLLKWLDSSVAGWSSGYVTRLIQELNPMIFIPYSYTYTCYAIEGSSVTVDSVASLDRINEVFKEKNLDQYIDQVAKDKIVPYVDDFFKNKERAAYEERKQKIQKAVDDLGVTGSTAEKAVSTLLLEMYDANTLTEKQLSQLINLLEHNKLAPEIRPTAFALLCFHKSPLIDDYFERIYPLSSQNTYTNEDQSIIKYFISRNNNIVFFRNLLKKSPNTNFINALIQASKSENPEIIGTIFNDDLFVDIMLEKYGGTHLPFLINNWKEMLKDRYSEKELDKLLLFKMKF